MGQLRSLCYYCVLFVFSFYLFLWQFLLSLSLSLLLQDDVVAVGSECHDVLFYSTADGNPLGSLKGHSNRYTVY